MLIKISKLLTQQQLTAIQTILSSADFVDGKLSAGKMAETVKFNQEIDLSNPILNQLNTIVMNTLIKNPTYLSAAIPKKVASPFYAKYTKGMAYGEHIDDPIMGSQAQVYRSDISITIFLNSPSDYDGGELVINNDIAQQEIKLAAGDAVLYPASSIHHVNKISRGERQVAVTWVQSMVRSVAKRTILFDLASSRDQLLASEPQSDLTTRINNSYANLLRMWADC